MPYPKYLFEGALSSEGKKLIEWLEVNIAEAMAPGASPHLFNSMSGPLKEYASIVRGPSQYPVDKWLTTFRQSADNAWQIMTDVEAKAKAEIEAAAKLNETVNKTTAIEEKLNALQETLSKRVIELEAENTRLLTENDALKNPKPTAKSKSKTKTEEPITEDDKEVAEEPESE